VLAGVLGQHRDGDLGLPTGANAMNHAWSFRSRAIPPCLVRSAPSFPTCDVPVLPPTSIVARRAFVPCRGWC